ncbi:MAG TPA: hypothetical protein DCL53_10935 [Thauera sp.]|nr:hypothetical protein [Thauera sp.]
MNAHSRKALRALIEGGVTIEYERKADRLLLAGDIQEAKRLRDRIVKHRAHLIPAVIEAEQMAEQLLSRIMADVKAEKPRAAPTSRRRKVRHQEARGAR